MFSDVKWSLPLAIDKHEAVVQETILRHNFTCQFCGVKTMSTENEPQGRLNACLDSRALAVESSLCYCLCNMCAYLGSVKSLCQSPDDIRKLGTFIEYPWITQSELINTLRIVYCIDTLAKGASVTETERIKKNPIYINMSLILRKLERKPVQWETIGFEGKPQELLSTIESFSGYSETNAAPYLTRLRFLFHPNKFEKHIQFWSTSIEKDLF